MLFSDAAGVVAGTLRAEAVVSTAAGTDDCRVDACFVALFALAGGPSVQLQNLTFVARRCAAPGSCAVPADWAAASPARAAGARPRPATDGAHRHPAHAVTAHARRRSGRRPDRAGAGHRPVGRPPAGLRPSPPGSPGPPPPPVSGEGLVRLALRRPGHGSGRCRRRGPRWWT